MQTHFSRYVFLLTLFAFGAGAASADEPLTTRVSTLPLEQALVKVQQSAPASVMSLNDGTLSAQLAAQIDTYHVEVGDSVKQGDTLVSLDCREAVERLSIARAALTLAEKARQRARSLSNSNNIAEQNLNEADASFKRAQGETSLASIQVEHCNVKAPFDGIVTARLATRGELAAIGAPLLALVDANNVELSAQLNPAQTRSLQKASNILFSRQDEGYEATLRTVLPIIHAKQYTVEARLTFDAQPPPVGTSGRITWSLSGHFLNTAYVQERNGELGYFVADGDTARFITLKDAPLGTPPLLESTDAQAIIDDGRHALIDGSAISVVETP